MRRRFRPTRASEPGDPSLLTASVTRIAANNSQQKETALQQMRTHLSCVTGPCAGKLLMDLGRLGAVAPGNRRRARDG